MGKARLREFKREVLDIGGDAVLPTNLPEKWLDQIDRDLEMVLEKNSQDHQYVTVPLAAVTHLLNAKGVTSFSDQDLFNGLRAYHAAIKQEKLRRSLLH